MGLAAVILAAGVMLSRVMGLVRDKIISVHHGASLEADIYFAAFVIPDFINYLLAGGYFAITLIPLLSEYFDRDEEDGWAFFSCVGLWVLVVSACLTLAAMALAGHLAELAAPGFGPEALARLTRFLRIILPAQVFFLSGSMFTALLYLRRRFTAPALMPLVYNAGIILLGLAMLDQGMEGFCWGVLVGSFVGNFLMPLAAAWAGGLRLRPRLWHPGLGRFTFTALPLMLGQSIVVLDEQLLRVFGSMAEQGAVSHLNYARRIMLVPVGVVAQATGVASYPYLAGMAARGDTVGFAATLRQALGGSLCVMLPLAALLAAVAEPAVRLLFLQGAFGQADVAATALMLRVMCLALLAWGAHQLLSRAFYAHGDTLRPVVAGSLATVCFVPLYWQMALWWGGFGVAMASATAVTGYTVLLALWWRRRHGAAALGVSPRAVAAPLLAAAIAGSTAWAATRALCGLPGPTAGPHLAALIQMAGAGLVFAGLYIPLAHRLAPGSLGPLAETCRRLRARLGRS